MDADLSKQQHLPVKPIGPITQTFPSMPLNFLQQYPDPNFVPLQMQTFNQPYFPMNQSGFIRPHIANEMQQGSGTSMVPDFQQNPRLDAWTHVPNQTLPQVRLEF